MAVPEPAAATSAVADRPPPGALAAGIAVLSLLAVAVAAAWPGASPLSPDHTGTDHGWSWLYLAAMAAAFVAYVAGVWLLHGRMSSTRAVLAVAIAIQVLPLAGPLLLSTDAYTYWAYGRIPAVLGENPYETPPDAFPSDPGYARMGEDWRDTTSVYGPAFTLATEAVAATAGDSGGGAAWTFRAVATLSMVALTLLAARLGRWPGFAAAFVGWNPLLAVHFAGGGHNDALMMALVLAALALAASGRRQLAGAAWALSIAIKWVPVVFLGLRAAEARGTGRPVSHLGFAAAVGILLGVSFWRYGSEWVGSVVPLVRNLEKQAVYSIPHRLSGLGISEDGAALLMGGLFLVAYALLLREAWRGRVRLGLTAGLLLVATPWLVPWYAVWAVPLAAVEEDRMAQILAIGISAYLLRDAVPL